MRMSKKNALRAFLSVFLTFTMLAGAWQSAFARFVDDNEISIGHQGIFVPGGINPDFFEPVRVGIKEMRGAPIRFIQPLIRIEVKTASGGRQTVPTALTYVYFSLNGQQMRAWNRGNYAIYYRDSNTGFWRSCNAFVVDDTTNLSQSQAQNQSNNNTGSGGRVACIAPQYTVFGLGGPRSGMAGKIDQDTSNQSSQNQGAGSQGTSP